MLARKLARPSIKETLGLKITLQPKIYISKVIQSACRGGLRTSWLGYHCAGRKLKSYGHLRLSFLVAIES